MLNIWKHQSPLLFAPLFPPHPVSLLYNTILLTSFSPPRGIHGTALSNALNYTHHWFTELRIGAEEDACFHLPLLASWFAPLTAHLSPLPEQQVNKNRQTNERPHIKADRGLGLTGSPGDLSCVSYVKRLIALERGLLGVRSFIKKGKMWVTL